MPASYSTTDGVVSLDPLSTGLGEPKARHLTRIGGAAYLVHIFDRAAVKRTQVLVEVMR